jgi:hypothetical protein
VNAGKTISRQHQNLTGFSVDIAENYCMNPLTFMGSFVIHVEGMRREKIMRKRDRNSEEACCGISPTPYGEMPQMQPSLYFALVITFL